MAQRGVRRGAPLGVPDDDTPLDGSRIRVDVRLGWVLRTARLTAPEATRLARLGDMVTALGDHGVVTSAATLHRLETGQLRDGGLVEGYERVLGREPGALRAPLDAFCRTFPYGPGDRAPGGRATSVAAMDALLHPLVAGVPTGSDWWRWARALAQPNALGLPTLLATPLVSRLVSEMGRSHGVGYVTRYEALSLLRRSAYGAVVLDVARAVVAEPHPQVLLDLTSAVGESAGQGAEQWLLGLLDDPRDLVVAGGVVGLENLAAVSDDPGVWRRSVEPALAAYNRHEPDGAAWHWLAHLLRLLPPEVRSALVPRLDHPLPPVPEVRAWTRDRLNTHWSTCEILAGRLTDALGLPEQPVLARLLLELATGEEESLAITGGMLLGALPPLAEGVGEILAGLAEEHPDPVVRQRSGRRVAAMMPGSAPAAAATWWRRPGELQAAGFRIAGTAGTALDRTSRGRRVLGAALRGDDLALRRAATYAAGMSQDPLLAELAADDGAPEQLRGAARWWLDEGGRVPR